MKNGEYDGNRECGQQFGNLAEEFFDLIENEEIENDFELNEKFLVNSLGIK